MLQTMSSRLLRGTVEWGDRVAAPDGRAAVARLGADKTRFTLFAAMRNDGRVLADAFAYDVVWLPAVSALRASGR